MYAENEAGIGRVWHWLTWSVFDRRKAVIRTEIFVLAVLFTCWHYISVYCNFQILHMHIANIEKLPLTTTGSPLLIRCKTFLSVTFVIPKERDCHNIYVTLQQLSQPSSVEDLYCFTYSSSVDDIPKSAGWNFFDLQSEYQRMGIPNDQWCLTMLNKDYEVWHKLKDCANM